MNTMSNQCCANCGISSPNYGQSTGSTSWASKINGDVLCWDCAREHDIEALKTDNTMVAYVSDYDIVTFPGRKIARISHKGGWNYNSLGNAKWRSIYGDVEGIYFYGREYNTRDCILLHLRKHP